VLSAWIDGFAQAKVLRDGTPLDRHIEQPKLLAATPSYTIG
jgi:hypothetical protein